MQGLKSKASAAVITALLASLPADEGGVSKGFSKPYVDIAGVKTVCYGHTGKGIENRLYTEAECNVLLTKDIERHLAVVNRCLKREIPTSMLVGFVSFDFNTGGFCSSRAMREANAGKLYEACHALAYNPSGLPAWSYINKTIYVEGLFQRRLRERKVCLQDVQKTISFDYHSLGFSWSSEALYVPYRSYSGS